MKLVKITTQCSVAPDQVAMLRGDERDGGVHVHMKSGKVLFVQTGYGESSFKTLNKMEKLMKLVKITTQCSVAPDQVAMLRRDESDRGVHVHMKSGKVLFAQTGYAVSSFKTLDKLEKLINEAMG